ncbi:Rh08 [macacine betaherpesvirus 3]|nr:Rh08 [macacine betaherpesvirus 3]QQL11411.1 Rh08 [macacine betaherpesvirus 3]
MNAYHTLISCLCFFILYAYITESTRVVTLQYVYNVSIGENVTLSKPDNLSFQLHSWFCNNRASACNNPIMKLCEETAGNNKPNSYTRFQNNCHPPTFTCNTTGLYLYNVQETDPTTYTLTQRAGNGNITDRNTTYIIHFITSTTPPPLQTTYAIYLQPVAQTHATTNYSYITITLTVITLILFMLGAGYLKHRRSLKHYKQNTHKCTSLGESRYPESSI